MTDMDLKVLGDEFTIIDNLSPTKKNATFTAYTDNSDLSFIIKIIDEHQAMIYQKLIGIWNPYIASVYEVKKLCSCYAAVTEHIFGESLTEYISNHGCLDELSAVNFCIMICDGLSSVHSIGIIHKDITPNNILITDDHRIKLIDFGIARDVEHNLSNDTEILGTRGFVAPEVRSNVPSSTRSDIYSVGCVLNYMLTGKEPGTEYYDSNSFVRKILDSTVCIDPSDRYRSIEILKKNLLHLQHFLQTGKYSFIHYIPGFRSHTPWKMAFSSSIYTFMIFLNIYEYYYHELKAALITDLFWIFIPIVISCNPLNIFRYLPHRLKSDTYYFNILRLFLILVSILLGAALIIDWNVA